MNTNQRRDMPPMPKVANLPGAPVPQARPNRLSEQAFAEEALRSAQHVIDQAAEIDRLGEELEDWRRRALMAEAEMKRLDKRNDDLQGALERERERLTDERDGYRMKLNNMMAQFHTAGAVILKCIEAGQGTVASPVSLTKLADEIEGDNKSETDLPPEFREVDEPEPSKGGRRFGPDEPLPRNEPLPRSVTAGPRES